MIKTYYYRMFREIAQNLVFAGNN